MPKKVTKTCEYEGCNLPVNKPHDNKFCIFHASKENKGITVEEFNNKIFEEKINKNDFNFEGYVFPGKISFFKVKNKEFKSVNFKSTKFLDTAGFRCVKFLNLSHFNDARFSRDADFGNVQFLGEADFSGTQFSGDVDFAGTKFSEDIYFNYAQFSKMAFFTNIIFSSDVNYSDTQFLSDSYFIDTRFSGGAFFTGTQFLKDVNFTNTKFLEVADFRGAQFLENANFWDTRFSKITYFVDMKFSGNAVFFLTKFFDSVYFLNNFIQKNISFVNIVIQNDSYFYFRNPKFKPNIKNNILINFTGINFFPFKTYFENIEFIEKYSKETTFKKNICLLFRYCQLEDVYFTKNNMSFFSFYKSNFDRARFVSCDWREENDSTLKIPCKYKRKNILLEEFLFLDIPENKDEEKKFRKKYKIEDLGLREISSLYRRMKTALDRTKDYQESGWFYFNEFETKRKALKNGPKKLIYTLYKLFSGYGEKPLWSFIWFWIFTFIFSFLHLVSGLKTSTGIIKYHPLLTKEAIRNIISSKFWVDWFYSIIFTIYRLIPINYMPETKSTITPVGLHGLILALLNTLILILMVTFIGVGLKRQFRRF